MKFFAFGALAMVLFLVDHCSATDVTGVTSWPPAEKLDQKDSPYKVKYREFHVSSKIRVVKLECSQQRKNLFQTTECYGNDDPHKNCDYTKDNAANYYEKLAKKFATYGCASKDLKLKDDCTWNKVDCPTS